ncbi:hypothetical protein ACTZWW_19425 [Salinarimonas sp. NSM]|uniref:hypothetical protein n=1 Tax=Salinarimonas sp. NSM TaxID=3458003 RepID=UPI0040370AD0
MSLRDGPSIDIEDPDARRLESRRVMIRFGLRMVIIVCVAIMAALDGAAAARALHRLLLLGFYVCLILSVLRRERFNAPVLNGMDEAIWYLMLAVVVGLFVDPSVVVESGTDG